MDAKVKAIVLGLLENATKKNTSVPSEISDDDLMRLHIAQQTKFLHIISDGIVALVVLGFLIAGVGMWYVGRIVAENSRLPSPPPLPIIQSSATAPEEEFTHTNIR